ncbi:MAG: hypothetical protein HY525_20255 [Betaproteobacteria bacterium]|nr:hypothetical protein [Betaproteobacteria bacterium]
MDTQHLYRGVSVRFHTTNAGLLKPKVQGPFTYNFHWDEPGAAWDSGITWDSTVNNAVIRHQLNQEGFPTAGISTTPHLDRAVVYARGKDGTSDGYVYKIDRIALSAHGVSEFVVAKYCSPSIPQDDEVILVVHDGAHLPAALVVEVLPVAALVA